MHKRAFQNETVGREAGFVRTRVEHYRWRYVALLSREWKWKKIKIRVYYKIINFPNHLECQSTVFMQTYALRLPHTIVLFRVVSAIDPKPIHLFRMYAVPLYVHDTTHSTPFAGCSIHIARSLSSLCAKVPVFSEGFQASFLRACKKHGQRHYFYFYGSLLRFGSLSRTMCVICI